jgi:hypothetical protein
MIHDRTHHLARRRITYLLRRALGDLFLGPYSARSTQAEFGRSKPVSTEGQHSLSKVVPFGGAGHDRDAVGGTGARDAAMSGQQLWDSGCRHTTRTWRQGSKFHDRPA